MMENNKVLSSKMYLSKYNICMVNSLKGLRRASETWKIIFGWNIDLVYSDVSGFLYSSEESSYFSHFSDFLPLFKVFWNFVYYRYFWQQLHFLLQGLEIRELQQRKISLYRDLYSLGSVSHFNFSREAVVGVLGRKKDFSNFVSKADYFGKHQNKLCIYRLRRINFSSKRL